MNTKNAIFLLSGTAILYWLFQKFTFSQKVKFDISNISFGGSFYNPIVILTIAAINTSNIETKISNINAELKLNNQTKIADIFFTDQVSILPYSSTLISLNIYPTINNIISSIKQVIEAKKGNFDIVGTATIDGIKIPLTLNYQIA